MNPFLFASPDRTPRMWRTPDPAAPPACNRGGGNLLTKLLLV